MRKRPGTVMARCCPSRVAVRDGLCKLHLERTLTVETSAVAAPDRCPHCRAEPPGWQRGADASHCFYCGATWERRIVVIA